MKHGLTRLVGWSQQLLAELLAPGDLAIDLTAGTGRDTLFLARQVAPGGTLLAFDIQPAALAQTGAQLTAAGLLWQQHPPDVVPQPLGSGVHLLPCGHERLAAFLPGPPRAVIANLGYLPGGDPAVTTRAATSVAALQQALAALAPGGRCAVVLYVGHPGGAAEAAAVAALFAGLPPCRWQVLQLQVANLPQAPQLLVAQKKS